MKKIKVKDDRIVLISDASSFEGGDYDIYTVDDDAEIDITKPFSKQFSLVRLNTVKALEETDKKIIRIIEDIFDILVSKGLIQETDLTEPAREKLQLRKSLRNSLQ